MNEGVGREAMVEELVRVRGTLRRVLSSLKGSVPSSSSSGFGSAAAAVQISSNGGHSKPLLAAADALNAQEMLFAAGGAGQQRRSALDVSSPPPLLLLPLLPGLHEALQAENKRLALALAARDAELRRRKQLADLQDCLHGLDRHKPRRAEGNAARRGEPETF
jgi:hypothetical protein